MLAAGTEQAIGLGQIARAVEQELAKENRQIRRAELGFLADYLEEPGL